MERYDPKIQLPEVGKVVYVKLLGSNHPNPHLGVFHRKRTQATNYKGSFHVLRANDYGPGLTEHQVWDYAPNHFHNPEVNKQYKCWVEWWSESEIQTLAF